jgi:outer membrane protein TolC
MEPLEMGWYESNRRARIITLVTVLATSSVSAFAQTGQSRLTATPASLAAAMQQPGGAAPRPGDTPQQPGAVARQLSIDDAVRQALEQNLGIRIQRFDPQIQDTNVAQARSFWAPTLTSSFSRNAQTQQPTSALAGGATSILNGTTQAALGMNQTLPWGGNYTASWNSQRFTSTNLFQAYSPQLGSNLNLQYTQPLLRNLDIDQIRQQVAVSKKSRELSDIQLRTVVTQTTRNVRNAYWDLVYALNNYKAQQQSLELSQQSLRDNQKRVEIGTLAPIDIVQSQAEVASNEQGVIIADAQIKQAQDNLRALILDPAAADFWSITFEPTDAPVYSEQEIDIDAAVRSAIEKRTDLAASKNSLDQSDINIKYFKNQIRPDVNANVSYITTAAGGTQLSAVDLSQVALGGVPNRTVINERGFGSVLGDVLQSSYPNWTVGVSIGYPLGASTAHANLARVRLEYEQSLAQLKNQELSVATQVRAVGRQVQTNQKRVQAARAARELQEKKLEAEEKKLAAGMSSTFLVFQAQRDLSLSRTAEVQAVSDYNKSLVDFQAVQEVPLSAPLSGGLPINIAR